MSTAPFLTLLAVTTLQLLSGCTDADREMASRKSDGTDTFVYKPSPAAIHGSKVPNGEPKNTEKVPGPVNEGTSVSSETKDARSNSHEPREYKYKPSRRVLEQKNKK